MNRVSNKILIDANLLTLLIVGCVSEEEIVKCRRTKKYTAEDYRLLNDFLSGYDNIIITPNIATETNNLLGTLTDKYLDQARNILAEGLSTWVEEYVKSKDVVSHERYLKFGLTDAGIHMIATSKTEVITDDFPLYNILSKNNVAVTNFTHLRASGWS